MSFEKELSELNSMRRLESGEMASFESILNDLALKADNSIIQELCGIFDDGISEPSGDEYLLEIIYYITKKNGIENGMYELAKGVNEILARGKKWAVRVHKSILDSNELIQPYTNAVKKLEGESKETIVDILKQLKEKKPDKYAEKVDKIILELS